MSNGNGRRLPTGWAEAPLGSLGDYINGRGFKKSEWRRSGRPIIRIQDLTGSNNSPNYFDGPADERHVVKDGDLLISWAATLGAYIWRGPEAVLNQHIFKVHTFIDKRFHYLLTQYVLSDMLNRTHGTGMVHITKGEFDGTIAPLPPLAEQSRISDTLDELLSDVDAGVEALQRVRKKLKLYRASVLKAAVEGTLTAEWRGQHPHNIEPATELLERILSERRRRWEEDQVVKFKAKGQDPPENWKARYTEPVAPEPTDLPTLPKGWCWATLDQGLWQLRSGTGKTSQREPTDYPVLKSSAVRHGVVDFEDLNYLLESQSLRSENFLQRGDLLITRLSGSLSYVGCSAVVRDVVCERTQYPDRIFCGKLVNGIDGTYLSFCFRHSRIRKTLEEAAKSTAGHQRISMSDLITLTLPLPSLAEQQAIVDAVEDHLSVIDHLEADLDANLKNAQGLRQSLLRHAFTGQLVPQDPNDEPASELLNRIVAERDVRAREAAVARRPARAKTMARSGQRGRPKKTKDQ